MLAEGRVPAQERRQVYYDTLVRESTRLQRLVEALLNFGRMEAGVRKYRFEEMDAASLVEKVVSEFAPQIAGSGRHIELEGAQEVCPIDADPEALSVALRNLVDNALKYSPGCPTVWVQWGAENSHVAIRVRDRGMGIPAFGAARHLPQVLPRNRRGHCQREGVGCRVGHGAAHRGGAWRRDFGGQRAGRRQHVHHPAAGGGIEMTRILVVEDEPGIALGLEDDLKLEGYDVEVVGDGAAAARRAREGGFDLILLDVMLPGKDGFEICRELRRAGMRVPILMLTAKTQEAEKVMGLELGADDYVTKPFGTRELRARIKACCGAPLRPKPKRSATASATSRSISAAANCAGAASRWS
jgi:CheY-like chemotaxis protein